MPSITKKHNKNSFSFKITVSCGYDKAYRKKRHYKVWKAPEGWSEQRAEREAQKVAYEFEKSIKLGFQPDNNKTFAEYAVYVIDLKEHTGTKHSTIELYKHLCERIFPAIGHIKLTELRPQHLNRLYIDLLQNCTKHVLDKARSKVDLGALLIERQISRAKLAKMSHLNAVTITSACRGQVIRKSSADAISAALAIPSKKPINYFQPKDIQRIIQALESEPLKWKTITHLFIVTGARRGEIMGLKWENVHLDERYIYIEVNLRYSKARGVYEETPKTDETRFIPIPVETVALLREYRVEQEKLRELNGDRWQNNEGFLFTRDDGRVMYPDSITAWLNKFSKRHDLPHTNPHAFRHTVASVLIANHTDVVTVARQLGHSSPATTEMYYAHLIEQSRVQAGECIADVMLRDCGRKES